MLRARGLHYRSAAVLAWLDNAIISNAKNNLVVLATTLSTVTWFFAILGFIGTLASLGFIRSLALKEFLAKFTPRLMGLPYKPHWTTDDINKAITSAEDRVWILQTWIPTLNRDISHWSPLHKNVTFRVLLGSDRVIAARLKYRPTAVSLRNQNSALLHSFVADLGRGEVRFFSGLPFGPIYIVDDQVYWGIYLANMDSMRAPRFRCSTQSAMGKMIVESFEAIWNATETQSSDTTEIPHTNGQQLKAPAAANGSQKKGIAMASPEKYQRYCAACGTWLSYRPTAKKKWVSTLESYCANSECVRFDERVEDVHVS